MTRLASRGFLFRCDLRDAVYAAREQIMLDELELEEGRKIAEACLHADAATVLASAIFSAANPEAPRDGFRSALEGMEKSYKTIRHCVAPWLEEAQQKASSPASLVEAWERVYGKMSSPEVQAELKRMKEPRPPGQDDGQPKVRYM